MKTKGYIMAVIGSISYGLIPLFILPLKSADFPLESVLFYRFMVAALILLAYLFYTRESLRTNTKELIYYALLGLMFSGSSEFLFLGYDYSSPGIASTILFVYPVIVALIMALVYREKLTKLTIFSLLVTTLGVLTLGVKGNISDFNFLGTLFSVLSAACYAIYIVIVNKAKINGSGFKITFYSILFSSIYFLSKALLEDKSLVIPNIEALVEVSLFALITTVISMTTLVYAIKWIGSTPAAIMGALEPVVAVAISVLIFHEQMTLTLTIGVIVILIGVIINMVSEDKKIKHSI